MPNVLSPGSRCMPTWRAALTPSRFEYHWGGGSPAFAPGAITVWEPRSSRPCKQAVTVGGGGALARVQIFRENRFAASGYACIL